MYLLQNNSQLRIHLKLPLQLKKSPEKIAALEIGITILKKVDNSDKPKLLDKLM